MTNLDDGHVESFVHKAALKEHQEIKVPGSTEVGDDDGVYRHGSEKLAPRCRPQGWHRLIRLTLA
jgi:hypothetical protein